MQELELHDLSDDAASIQQGSASIMQSESCKRSSSNEPEGAEIVYTKDNTWIPYKGQSSNVRLPEKDKNLYTITAVPFSDIRSIHRHMPTLGWQYIIVVMSSGLAFPPLYFYNGGAREFLATIKQHVFLVSGLPSWMQKASNGFKSIKKKNLLWGSRARRKEIWTFLLGFHAYDSTYAEREHLMSVKKSEYETTKKQWQVLANIDMLRIWTRYRSKIMGEQMDFDTLLKFINELSGQIDLDATLREAEALCICAGENGAACIPPGTPPSLPIEDA